MTNNERNTIKILMETARAVQNPRLVEEIKARFLKEFPVDIIDNPEYVLQLLERAYFEKNGDDVEFAFIIAGNFNLVNENYLDMMIKLMKEDWHVTHECIASYMQQLKSPKTIDCLYEAALTDFPYLEFDEAYALAVKCIWALGEINTPESYEKLKLLTQSNNEIIKENAIYQLELDR